MDWTVQQTLGMVVRVLIYLGMAEAEMLLVATARAVVAMERENIVMELWQ